MNAEEQGLEQNQIEHNCTVEDRANEGSRIFMMPNENTTLKLSE
jgi:hypothetical protein